MEHLPAYDDLDLPADGELVLRPWRTTDIPAVTAACRDPSTQRFIAAFRGYDESHARAYVTGAGGAWQRRQHLRLCLSDGGGSVVGAVDVDDIHQRHSHGELGWWVAPDLRGRSVGVRGARLGVQVGQGLLGLRRVFAEVVADNISSRWLAAAAGLHLESTAVAAWADANGAARDMETWRLLATEDPLTPQPDITAGRLHLRPFRPSDADAVLQGCQDPEVSRWTTVPSPYSRDLAVAFTSRDTLTTWASGRGGQWAVVDSTDGRLLACLGLHRRPGAAEAEVGFWAMRGERGQGVVTEALRALARYAFAALGVQRLGWKAIVGNEASRRVATKAGFREEGLLRATLPRPDGSRADCWVASLLPADLLG